MMNLKEGFRRIGVVISLNAALSGVIVAISTGSPLEGILVAVVVLFVGFVLLYVVAYVIKGFMKQSDEKQGKD